MNYLFISNNGESAPIAWRLEKEGHEVSLYLHNKKFRGCYDGILNKVKLQNLQNAVDETGLVVMDMNKPVENEHDKKLQALFGAKGDGLFGSVADALRDRDKRVLGVSAWGEELELDRRKGSDLARSIGLAIPETQEFDSLRDGADFLKGRSDLWVFKPFENQDLDLTYVEKYPGELLAKLQGEYTKRLPDKIEFILQEKIEGHEIDCEAWWTGSKWVCQNHTIEDKHFLTGNLGPHVGSMNNTVWLKRKKGLLSKAFDKLALHVKRNGHVGPMDVNVIISKKNHKPYFLEWTSRPGFDALFCLLTLLKSPLSTFFKYVSGRSSSQPQFKRGYASSIRISIPPYPYEDKELLERAEDVQISGDVSDMWLQDVYESDDGLVCTGCDGIIGVLAKHGWSIPDSAKKVYRAAEKLNIGSYLQYRTDLGARCVDATRTLKQWEMGVS